ncbi:hypothetical protein QJS66_19980 [Kocuria rhizophila]|nr:hypothetical protein QJS66_19980 [Kocuria rhizophila]
MAADPGDDHRDAGGLRGDRRRLPGQARRWLPDGPVGDRGGSRDDRGGYRDNRGGGHARGRWLLLPDHAARRATAAPTAATPER